MPPFFVYLCRLRALDAIGPQKKGIFPQTVMRTLRFCKKGCGISNQWDTCGLQKIKSKQSIICLSLSLTHTKLILILIIIIKTCAKCFPRNNFPREILYKLDKTTYECALMWHLSNPYPSLTRFTPVSREIFQPVRSSKRSIKYLPSPFCRSWNSSLPLRFPVRDSTDLANLARGKKGPRLINRAGFEGPRGERGDWRRVGEEERRGKRA